MPAIDDQATQSLLDGRYRLEACVGRGATSLVYRAEDLLLGRPVAIKMLRAPDDMPISLERVRTESKVLATLNHPSLVTLYDARLDPGHPQYLAMEYVEGPTLASRLVGGPLSSAETASLARDIAEGLQTVHEASIIHRDVKPSNVLMAQPQRPGDRVRAKLTDFGIAFGLDDARRTSPGVAIGTAAYMAPEQVRVSELTTAVDVYSLGLVLIEALGGEPAFPISGDVQTALRRLSTQPEIPETFSADWRDLLSRMTRIDPEARPSAGEVAEAAARLESQESRPEAGARASVPVPVTPVPDAAHESSASRGPAEDGLQADDGPEARTRVYTGAKAAGASGPSRRGRRAAAVVVGALALSLAGFAGLWTTVSTGDDPAPVASRAPATGQPTNDSAEPEVQTASVTDSGSGADGSAVVGADDQPGKQPNPNKGPGNNSGSAPGTNSGNGSSKQANPNTGPDPSKAANPNKGPGNNSGSGPDANSGNGKGGSGRGSGAD